jgi:two-component system, OmpR family, sensor histidine kinase MtrB
VSDRAGTSATPFGDHSHVAALQTFIATASHELRTPIAGIVGAAETLQGGWDRLAEDDRRQLVELLVRQSRRLSRLVDELLELSRLEAGAVEVAVTPVNVAAEARSAAEDAGMADVIVSCPSDLTVTADRDHLHRILVNLLVNADTHGARPIVVEGERLEDQVEVRVTDAGPGVPVDFVLRLFERFSRADPVAGSSGRPRPGGAGLGLAIVSGLGRLGGGEVSYRPRPAGGAVFCVRLPPG